MKVLQVSLSNIGGGASKIVSDLHDKLLFKGIDSELLIFEGKSSAKVKCINDTFYKKYTFRLKNLVSKLILNLFINKSYDCRSINLFPSSLAEYINNSDADIVHFHWIGAEMISIKQIGYINKKIIWTLHDAWALNGTYHINPNDYLVDSDFTVDLSNFFEKYVYKKKVKYLANKNIIFTSPSRWLLKKYSVSFYSKINTRCFLIHNFIDLSIWFPIGKQEARNQLSIKSNKKIIVFGANNALTSFNKGYNFIKELMSIIPKEIYCFLIFGNNDDLAIENNGVECIFKGKVKDQNLLRLIYSAGDFTIVPSLSESFSLVSLESIACNTPVLAFNTSGIKDIVSHKKNGFLAKKFDINSLREGLFWLSNNQLLNINVSVTKFSKDFVINQFIDLYNQESTIFL